MMSISLPIPSDSSQRYLAEIARLPVLSREEEHALAVRYYETGNLEAAQRLALANLRFVVKIAHEYQGYGLRMADLIGEGNIGLLVAIKKFNPYQGTRLISYAVWWIRAYIQNFILRSWSLVKIGTTQAQRKLFYKLKESKRRLCEMMGTGDYSDSLNRWGTEQLAAKMDLPAEEVAAMDRRLAARDLSLDTPLNEDQTTTHLDLLAAPAEQEEAVAREEETHLMQAKVQQALQVLTPREQYIITQRLMTDNPLTLQEIGDHFNISRERARQLEARALKKLKGKLQPLQQAV